MRYVPSVALFCGGVLTAFAVLCSYVIWIDATFGKSQMLVPQPPPKEFAVRLSEATSLDAVKKSCMSVAQVYDVMMQGLRTQAALTQKLVTTVVWGIVGVGFGLGAIFLFIYFATRKWVQKKSHIVHGP